jgi:hypothetical protein
MATTSQISSPKSIAPKAKTGATAMTPAATARASSILANTKRATRIRSGEPDDGRQRAAGGHDRIRL